VDATFLDLGEGVWGQALEGDLVVAGQVEGLDVLEGARGKEEPVIAEQALCPGGVDVQGDICGLAVGAITGLAERELDILVTCTCCVGDRVTLAVQLPNVHWDENSWIIRGNGVHIATVATCVYLVVSDPLLVDLGLDLGLLKGTSLSLIVADVGFSGWVYCLYHSRLRVLVSLEDLGDLNRAEVALLDLAGIC